MISPGVIVSATVEGMSRSEQTSYAMEKLVSSLEFPDAPMSAFGCLLNAKNQSVGDERPE
jgi:hypothetical protein